MVSYHIIVNRLSSCHSPPPPILLLPYFFCSPSPFFPPQTPPKYPPALFAPLVTPPATLLAPPLTPSAALCPYLRYHRQPQVISQTQDTSNERKSTHPPNGPWLSRLLPLSSLPPLSARLTPSFDSASPSGCARPPWPTCPDTRPWTPSCRLSTCSTPVTFVLSRFSGMR